MNNAIIYVLSLFFLLQAKRASAQNLFQMPNVGADKVEYFIRISYADEFSGHKDFYLFQKAKHLRDSLYHLDSLNFHINLSYRNWYTSRTLKLQEKLKDPNDLKESEKRSLREKIKQLKDSIALATTRCDRIIKTAANKPELIRQVYASYPFQEALPGIDTANLELCTNLCGAIAVDNSKDSVLFQKTVTLTDSLQKLQPENYFLTYHLGALYYNRSLDIIHSVNAEKATTEELEQALKYSDYYQRKSEPYMQKAEKLARKKKK